MGPQRKRQQRIRVQRIRVQGIRLLRNRERKRPLRKRPLRKRPLRKKRQPRPGGSNPPTPRGHGANSSFLRSLDDHPKTFFYEHTSRLPPKNNRVRYSSSFIGTARERRRLCRTRLRRLHPADNIRQRI